MFLHFSLSTNRIREILSQKRSEILTRIKKNLKAALIQRAYRKHLKIPEGKHHIILTSSNLLLYRSNILSAIKRVSKDKILKFISTSAHANLVKHQLGNFGIKILMIQKHYRCYAARKRFRLKKLHIFWKKCIDKIVFRRKSLKSKKKEGMKYNSIPSGARNRILDEYYLKCWVEFRKQMRDFMKSRLGLESECRIFKTSVEGPYFNYMPDEKRMEELIKALGNKKY